MTYGCQCSLPLWRMPSVDPVWNWRGQLTSLVRSRRACIKRIIAPKGGDSKRNLYYQIITVQFKLSTVWRQSWSAAPKYSLEFLNVPLMTTGDRLELTSRTSVRLLRLVLTQRTTAPKSGNKRESHPPEAAQSTPSPSKQEGRGFFWKQHISPCNRKSTCCSDTEQSSEVVVSDGAFRLLSGMSVNQSRSVQSNLWQETTSLWDTPAAHLYASQHHKQLSRGEGRAGGGVDLPQLSGEKYVSIFFPPLSVAKKTKQMLLHFPHYCSLVWIPLFSPSTRTQE